MAEIIDGKLVSSEMRAQTAKEVAYLKSEYGIVPGLAVILVGNNPASAVYVRNKRKACNDIGINSYEINLPIDVSEDELLDNIKKLNADPNVHGILVQLPLPKHIDMQIITDRINSRKDCGIIYQIECIGGRK